MFREGGHHQVRRRPSYFGVRLIGTLAGRFRQINQGLAIERVKIVLIAFGHGHGDGHVLRVLENQIVDELVAGSFLVLLTAGVEVARANGRERRRAAPLFAQAFRQELVIPMAQGFQFLRPDGQHARRLAKLFGHQVVDCRILERGVMFERLLEAWGVL